MLEEVCGNDSSQLYVGLYLMQDENANIVKPGKIWPTLWGVEGAKSAYVRHM